MGSYLSGGHKRGLDHWSSAGTMMSHHLRKGKMQPGSADYDTCAPSSLPKHDISRFKCSVHRAWTTATQNATHKKTHKKNGGAEAPPRCLEDPGRGSAQKLQHALLRLVGQRQ